mmetsp:Transcript_8676/g.14091  ORF Transcript_8676/g.14091 Transcript_8676/m.14091 type:complete len:145 (+) Transcript_8676:40-474(+)
MMSESACLEPIIDIQNSNPRRGARLFKESCAQCHSTSEEVKSTPMVYGWCMQTGSSQGPPLFGIIGRRSASAEGYPYSNALKSLGISWTDRHIYEYLANTAKYVPGMKYCVSVKKKKDRADIVSYMIGAAPSSVECLSQRSAHI